MRFRHFVVGFLAVLSFCLTRSAWSQLTYTVPVVDKSDSGSPLKISGTASFTELIVANSVKSSSSFKVDARNVGNKHFRHYRHRAADHAATSAIGCPAARG